MKKLKYVGTGIFSRGIKFSPTHNGGLYELDDADADYLLNTFPTKFILIEKVAEKKEAPKKRKPRKKKEAVEDTTEQLAEDTASTE